MVTEAGMQVSPVTIIMPPGEPLLHHPVYTGYKRPPEGGRGAFYFGLLL
jgi:hypothetical protein